MKKHRFFLLIIIACALLSISAKQENQKETQQAKPIQTGLTEKVEVNLVLLEAIVHDKKGSHIRGLKKEEFRVFEEGKEQKIAVFEEIDLTRKESFQEAAAKTAPEPVREMISEKKPPEEHRGRTFLFLFDVYNNPSALFLSQAKKAVHDFMEKRFNPEDIAAIFEMTPELSMVCNFTADPGEVVSSLDKIRYFPGRNAGDELIDQAANFKIPYKGDFTRRIAYAAALRSQLLRQDRQTYYYNLGSLAFTLSELPGKKMILLFSGGFPMTVPGDINDNFGGITPAFRDLISNMAKYNVSIYSFDIAELSVLSDASQNIDYRIPLDKLGFGEDFFENIGLGSSFWQNSMEARRQILAVLGNETGGSFLMNPDYKAGLTRIDDDTNHYYLLGYYPSEKVDKEKYRKIKINVTQSDAAVVARKGRFALKEQERNKSLPESNLQDAKKLQQEMKRPDETVIPCEVATIFSPLKDGRTRVTFAVQVLDKIDPFVNEQGNGIVDMTLKIYANAGQITLDSKKKDIKAILKPEGVQALADGFRILEYIDLVPAVYDFQLFLRLNGMSRYASWSKTLEVQKFKESTLELSTFSFAISQPIPLLFDPFSENTNPFELKNGMKIIPVATRSFHKGESIFLFYKVMNAWREEGSGKPSIDMNFKFLSQDGKAENIIDSNVQVSLLYFAPEKEGENLDALVELKVLDYKPGFYLLRATVIDKKSGNVSYREEKLQLL